uniref:Cytochrome P450 n=1 Tax=Tanacetum cinerariifolium TaxID=118510 RepID=A0A6L2NBG0_TANCI|nr:cytochrome P450 [Tanacetum cinerariifolium]
MNLLSLNIRGVGDAHKRNWVRRLCFDHNIKFVGIQETMSGDLNKFTLKSMWNNSEFDFAIKYSVGNSGGIVAMWDVTYFSRLASWQGEGYLALLGNWLNIAIPCDFNEVRSAEERKGTAFDSRGASTFNNFISTSGLIDLPMGAKRFTRMNNLGNKLSKIDRVLVSHHVIDVLPNSHTITLPSEYSDHTPILSSSLSVDFGATPFKLYNSWIMHKDFPQLVCWTSCNSRLTYNRPGPTSVSFKTKLQQLKSAIKQWRSQVVDMENMVSNDLRLKIDGLDMKAESSFLTNDEIMSRTAYVKSLADLEHAKLVDLRQKAKIRKWINWIHACLDSTFASVLVNSYPTKEFKLERRLRQGDPLSPILFILAMEALNVAFLEATNNNIFHGVQVGKDKTLISHLQYADDALILGEWSLINAKNLSRILTCFHLASGLKVNFNKSNLFGVGVSNIELNVIASSLGCLASQFPCSYLGLPVAWEFITFQSSKLLKRLFISSKAFEGCSFGVRIRKMKKSLGLLGRKSFHPENMVDLELGASWRAISHCLQNGGGDFVSRKMLFSVESFVQFMARRVEVLQLNDGPILQPTIPFAGPTFHWAWRRTLRVLLGRATDVLSSPPPQCTHNSADVENLKKKNKYLTKHVNLMMKLFRSDDKFSQMLNQYESSPEFGNASGSGGCGDDEMADDEDEEGEEDGDS